MGREANTELVSFASRSSKPQGKDKLNLRGIWTDF